jgi:CheY-like chemotaxis protein
MSASERPRIPLRILLLDDNADLLEIVAAELRREGWALEEFDDPQLAIERVEHGPALDVAVVDCWMGSRDSGEVVERLRATSPRIPVIYLSGDLRALARVRSAPDSFVLQKPFGIEELVALVSEAVGAAALHP